MQTAGFQTAASNKRLLYTVVISVTISFAVIAFFIYISRPKIAYIRTLEVIYGYNGMKHAHSNFKSQTDMWQSNLDTLRIKYERSVEEYKQVESALSAKEKASKENEILRLHENVNKYSTVISDQAQQREKVLTSEVLSQINAFVETYAKERGFDIVFGAEGTGSIMYGSKTYDITDEVLAALNRDYKLLGDEVKDEEK